VKVGGDFSARVQVRCPPGVRYRVRHCALSRDRPCEILQESAMQPLDLFTFTCILNYTYTAACCSIMIAPAVRSTSRDPLMMDFLKQSLRSFSLSGNDIRGGFPVAAKIQLAKQRGTTRNSAETKAARWLMKKKCGSAACFFDSETFVNTSGKSRPDVVSSNR